MAQLNLELLCFRAAFLAVLLPLTSGACVDLDLGVGSGKIPDSDITASSEESASTPATNGRLNYTSGSSWCAGTSDTNPYLQIDLHTLHIICALSTQGNSRADQWVKNYTLKISTDGIAWTEYKEGGQVKFLRGNDDRDSEVKHVVYGVLTRYLQFLPQTHQGRVCMRTEMFGVEKTLTCESEAIGLASTATIPDNSFSASSYYDHRYKPSFGRLNGASRGWGPKTATNSADYLQIDLLYEYVICAVATQGANGINEWTTNYKIQSSMDGITTVTYQETNVEKVFSGNSNQNGIIKNSLQEFASAKFIRFWPTAYHTFKVLRVEVYGVLLTKVPSQPPTAFSLTASSSTSITASWQLPPMFARHGRNITGFKLFYREKWFAGSYSFLNITSGSTLSRLVTGLEKYTEYEFQVLAYTSDGDGPKSPVMVEKTKGDGGCFQYDLGMEGGNIPDSRITASSSSTPAENGRINYALGASWCAGTSDTNPYLQIDLQTLHIICAVSTQGNSQADQWVKNYTLKISTDEKAWTDYKEGGRVKFLRGNDDRNSEVKHVVYGVLTRYLRFLPQTHHGGVCMRTEVFGVEKTLTCESRAIGLDSSATIPDSSFSASSYYDNRYKPSFGRLNGANRGWAPKTKTNSADYLQIDLMYEYVICAVATQGANGIGEWTTNYKIQSSMDGITPVTYQETNVDKVFPGNSGGNDGIIKNSLQEFASAKFIRFWPTAYHSFKVLRVEVYGVLLAKVPSQPPTAFNLTASSSTSITASWQLPPIFARHGRNITGFKLFYRQKDLAGCFSFLNITSESTLSRLVTGLEKYTEYEFQVLAYTSDGGGPKSSVEVERTLEDAPSRPPFNLCVTATSSTTVTASWQLPPADSRNGVIKGFKVFYKRKDSSGSETTLPINGGSTLNKNVTGLNKYTEYEFKVLAFTSVGDGPNSSVVVKRTGEDVPSQPPGGFTLTANTSTSITASWQLPPEDSRNGNITGYKLFYKQRGISRPASMKSINNEATRTQEVTGLDKFTEYEFQILAFTSVGDGPKSSAIFEKTKEAAPSGPPSQFSVTVNSSTSITASWHLPPEGFRHGIIRGYKLFYKKKGSALATSLTTDSGNTSKRVTNLDKYTEYEFQVLAFTSAGDGPKSSAVFTTTMEDAPSAPTSLSLVDVPPSSLHGPRITLSWSKPAEPNGVIRSYTLFYSHDGGAPKEDSGLDKDAPSHTVDVLGGVTYQFHVRAVTIKPGPNGTITVTTREYKPSRGPQEVSSSAVNSPKINITWLRLPREVAHGNIIRYEARLSMLENCTGIQSAYHSTTNTTTTYVLVTRLSLCAKYEVSVRGYTAAGPGPYSRPVMVQTLAVVWSKETPSSPSISANSRRGGISAKVTLPRFPGNARFFQVIIITLRSNYIGAVKPPGRFTTQDMMTYEEAHKSSVPAAYVAFQFNGISFDKNQEFVIGDGAQSSGKERSKRSSGDQYYYNKPLQLNTNYRVFLRAFVSETVYVSCNFVTIDTKGKPFIKGLPKTTITAIGALVLLNCEFIEETNASATWTKDGLASIPRAQLENNGKILIIKDVVPGDSGVYECKAINMFGESRTATKVIVAVPPRIIKELSPSTVICQKQSPCFLSCQATSYIPFNYSWTKDGQLPTSDNIKLMNNSLIVTPQVGEDYGEYVCHVTNAFGSTLYEITLLDSEDTQSIFLASVIPLSCIVFVLLLIICGLIWQRRRAVLNKRIQSKEEIDFDGVKSSPNQQSSNEQASDPNTYMELKPRPSNQESRIPSEYQSLQEKPENPGYYNTVLQKKNGGKQNEEVYEEI